MKYFEAYKDARVARSFTKLQTKMEIKSIARSALEKMAMAHA